MRFSLLTIAVVSLALSGCKSDSKAPPPASKPTDTNNTPPVAAKSYPPSPNDPPTIEFPAYEHIGVGQEIGFGLEVIDKESDDFVVELIEKPASATFDPFTLTVVWKPTAADVPLGAFAVKITETVRGGETRVATHHFSIDVSKQPQPLPVAQSLGAAVETLITIHDAERLALVNKEWPIDALLERAAQSAHAALPEAERALATIADRKALYESFLHNMAKANHNDTLEPTSEKFDAAQWGNPADWKIIALRPRLDKKWHELRIVYKAKSHAATYAMFKFRPYADGTTPEALATNNKAMVDLTLEAFFTAEGALDPTLFRDKKAHAERAASYMRGIVNFEDKETKWHAPTATFLGLPCEARLGGGNKRNADGTYASGDAWGWNVMKAKPIGGKLLMKNVPIKGFATAVKASADGKRWEMTCGEPFAGPAYAPLCRETGHMDLPATGDGYTPSEGSGDKLVSSLVEAANIHLPYKEKMVTSLHLHDPRRDLFEEKGMTCAQCHVRKFGVRDMSDAAAYDPSAGTPKALNKSQSTTYFVITPTERWQPYALDFQYKQECKFKKTLESLGKVKTSLACPLKAN